MPEVPVLDVADGLDVGPQPRACGRCRLVFEGDPTLHAAAIPQWWVCPTCRTILLPNRPKSDEVVALHRAGEAS